MGLRLSGWVAANRQGVINSDPMLDLGEGARVLKPSLRSCLSAPILTDNEVVGVLTVYSSNCDAFNREHQRILELVAQQLSELILRSIVARNSSFDLRAGLTSRGSRQLLPPTNLADLSVIDGAPCSLVLIDLHEYLESCSKCGEDAEHVVAELTRVVGLVVRNHDLLFRLDFGRVILLLPRASRETATAVSEQIARQVRAKLVGPLRLSGVRLARRECADRCVGSMGSGCSGGSSSSVAWIWRPYVNSLGTWLAVHWI